MPNHNELLDLKPDGVILLSKADIEMMIEMKANPRPPNAALKALFERTKNEGDKI